jgi:hypothetical protein
MLIAELRRVGPRAIATRHRLPALLRALRLPLPTLGVVRVDYPTGTIYTRDMWIHRFDICRATGRPTSVARERDGRVLALAVRDLARSLPKTPGGRDRLRPDRAALGRLTDRTRHGSRRHAPPRRARPCDPGRRLGCREVRADDVAMAGVARRLGHGALLSRLGLA